MAKGKKKHTKRRNRRTTSEVGWKRSNKMGKIPDLISHNLP